MWSGVIFWSGRWELEEDRAILTEENPPPAPVDAPRPGELEWSEKTGSPAERSPEGRLCAYEVVELRNPPVPIQPANDPSQMD
jgi:hypothetical protein